MSNLPKTEIVLPTKGRATARGHAYSLEDIERGLWAIALHGGPLKAHEILKAAGHPIPARTLSVWITSHATRLDEIRQEASERVAEKIAGESEAFILEALEVQRQALHRTRDTVDQLAPAEAAGALRNVTTSISLNLDKIASPLRGRPSRVIETRSADDIIRGLAARIPALQHALDEQHAIETGEAEDGECSLTTPDDDENARC